MSETERNAFEIDASAGISLKEAFSGFPSSEGSAPLRAVVIGGGTGAPVSIRTLLSMGISTSAVVAMADDGGSTGALREVSNVTPPGDIRKCLVAFAKDPDDPLTKAFRYRFDFEKRHVLGNLILAALEQTAGSFPQALQVCEKLLNTQGQVYPSTLDRITLSALTQDGKSLRGQARASASDTALEKVWLETAETCTPYEPALQAIEEADLIVLGPGSLFTSIIPNLLVPGMTDAIKKSKAKTLFVCSLADMQGETWGLSVREHVEALMRHGMQEKLDYVLVHSPEELQPDDLVTESYHAALDIKGESEDAVSHGTSSMAYPLRPVPISYADVKWIQEQGAVVLVRNLVNEISPTWHDPVHLKEAITGVLRLCHLLPM